MTYSQAKNLIKMSEADRMTAYHKIYHYMRSFGGTTFGMDWRTAKIVHPIKVEYLRAIIKLSDRQATI